MNEVDLDISCETGIEHLKIKQPSLLTGSNCKIYNGMDALYLSKNLKGQFYNEFNATYNISYSNDDLKTLESKLIRLPKIIDNNKLRQAKLSLDDAENMLKSIAINRRLRTWRETTMDWLSYLGYAALGLGSAYVLYRLGILEFIQKCMPKKLCIFCVKTKVTTPTNVVTYNSSLQPLVITEIPKVRRVRI